MPVEVKGIVEAQRALKQFAPDLYKEMNKEIRSAMRKIVDDARGMVQPNVYELENWQDRGKPVVSRTGRKLGFPRYNEALIKKGCCCRVSIFLHYRSGFCGSIQIQRITPSCQ